MDVLNEMSINNLDNMLGVNSQKDSIPIDMNFIPDNDSITGIFLKNSTMPNSNVNINIYKNANSKYELQAFNGFPLNTISEDIINSNDSICSSPDLTKMAYLNSNVVIPETQALDVPRVNFQSLDCYPNVNDFTEEYYPGVNNHYNNIYSIPKYRKLSNSLNNVDINVNMLLENDEIANNFVNPELLLNSDNNNYLPSLVNSPVPSKNDGSQFSSPNISSNTNTVPSFQFNTNFNNNTTSVCFTNNSVAYQNSIPQLVNSPLIPTKLLTINEEPNQIGQEMITPSNGTSLEAVQALQTYQPVQTVQPLQNVQPTQIQVPTQGYINNTLTNVNGTTASTPLSNANTLLNGMASGCPPKMVAMENVCPPLETYCSPMITSAPAQNMVINSNNNYSMGSVTYPTNTVSNQVTTASVTPLNYVPYIPNQASINLNNDFLLDEESLKNRKILTPTSKLNKIKKENTNSNLYANYIKANQNKLETSIKTETITSSLANQNNNQVKNVSVIQNGSPESVSSAESTELSIKNSKKRSLDSSEQEGNVKYYSISTTTSSKNNSLIQSQTTIENKMVNAQTKSQETTDTKQTPEDVITTSFGATVSTKALINGLIANPISSTTTGTVAETKKSSAKTGKAVRKRKSTKKEKPPKPEFYPCTYIGCGKVFNKPYNLKSHLKIHTNERPYQCQYCKARFSRGHDLNRHTRLHTGVKPFECQKCKKRFSRSDALSRHIKVEACLESNQNRNNKKAQAQTKNA